MKLFINVYAFKCYSLENDDDGDFLQRTGGLHKHSVQWAIASLRTWASSTRFNIDCIVVLIEDSEILSAHNFSLQSIIALFLSTMIPFSIVLCLPQYFEKDLLSSVSCNVWNHIQLKYFEMPTSMDLCRDFVKKLVIPSDGSLLPIDIRGNLMRKWVKSVANNGLMFAIDDLKLMLAHHFSRPGTMYGSFE